MNNQPATQRFTEFIESIARDRPLAGSYFGSCASMHWDAWRVVRLLDAELDRLQLPAPRQVLDLGCGIGVYEKHLQQRWPAAGLIGVDLSRHNLLAARHYHPPAAYLRCDGENLPLADAAVDLALAIEVMEHFLHPDRVAAELKRVVRPGGHAIIVVPLAPPLPCLDTLSRVATTFIGSQVIEEGEFREHMRIYNKTSLRTEFADGFRPRRLVTFNLMTFAVAAVEKLSPALAHWSGRRLTGALDRLDRLAGKMIYAKAMLVLQRDDSS